MRLVQIHAGIHKTGSTAIQHTLARLVPDLAEHGIALPFFGGLGQWHHKLAGFTSDPEGCARAWSRLTRRGLKSGADRIIISSEHFIRADPAALRDALTKLDGYAPRIHFYVRPHVALFTSLYLQRVKAGAVTTGPRDVAVSYATSPEFDYVPAIARFTEVFGADAVRLRAFEPGRFEGGSLISDLWAFLDLPPALLAKATEDGDTIVNPTPTAEQAVLLLALAGRLRATMGRAEGPQPLRSTLSILMTELRARLDGPSTTYRLPLDLQRAIKAQTEPGRAALAAQLDRPPSDAFVTEPLVAPVPLAPIPFDAVRDSLAATAAQLRDRDLAPWAEATEDFAARLVARPGPDGTPLLRLPAPRAHRPEGVT